MQRVIALELNEDVKTYSQWKLDPRWAGFFRDFRVRIESGLEPNGRVRDVFFSIRRLMKKTGQKCLYFTQGKAEADSTVFGTVFQVRCCCAVLFFHCVDSRAERKAN